MPSFAFFTRNIATQRVRVVEDEWNSRNPERVSLSYTLECQWRQRAELLCGRKEIARCLVRKWAKELDYRVIKEMWAFNDRRISVRCVSEWHDTAGKWFRSFGNEHWEFDDGGLMRRRVASVNAVSIADTERKFTWPLWRRPDDHPGLAELGL